MDSEIGRSCRLLIIIRAPAAYKTDKKRFRVLFSHAETAGSLRVFN